MSFKHISFDQFKAKPWKNGLGTTYDIALVPQLADHSNFDIRFALSPIVEDNIFSAFPDVERVITPIEGGGLQLIFDGEQAEIMLNKSLRFDSTLTPMGKLIQGPIKVVNVMARRERWRIKSCEVVEQCEHAVKSGELLFLFALENCSVQSSEEVILMARHDAVIIIDEETATITTSSNSKILRAYLQPV